MRFRAPRRRKIRTTTTFFVGWIVRIDHEEVEAEKFIDVSVLLQKLL